MTAPPDVTWTERWRCGKCDGMNVPLHSPRCPLRETTAPPLGEVCAHGSLKRQCRECELEADVERLTRERDEAKQALLAEVDRQDSDYVRVVEALALAQRELRDCERECAGRLTRDESVFIVDKQAKAEAEVARLRALLARCVEWPEHAADDAAPLGWSNQAVAKALLADLRAALGEGRPA